MDSPSAGIDPELDVELGMPTLLARKTDDLDRLPDTVLTLAISTIAGGLIGLLAAPTLLSVGFDALIQVPIEDAGSFREAGAIGGAVLGLLIGSLSGALKPR